MGINKRGMLVVALLAIVVAGCIGRVRKPEVVLNTVRVAGIGLRGASLIAELDINNQNDFDIETDSISYQLFANTSGDGTTWAPVLERTWAQRVMIKEEQTTRVEIPIEFNYSDLSGAARAILDRGTFNYQIRGNVFVREPLRRTMPFTHTGNVSLQGAR
jgi:LEA14-like dessication related protein